MTDLDKLYDEAVRLYNVGKKSTATKLFLQLAKQGHTDSMTALGNIYEQIDGEESHKTAIACYKDAARKGNPSAQYKLGCLYYEGKIVRRDYKASLKWYMASYKQGLFSIDDITLQDIKKVMDKENAGSVELFL